MNAADPDWPELPLAQWQETKGALHLWMQIVGKLSLALAPMRNHWWQTAFHLHPRGLATVPLSFAGGAVTARFDFVDHVLAIETSQGHARRIALEPRSVADFFAEFEAALAALGIEARIWPHPIELPDPVPFADDTRARPYDRDAVERFWRLLLVVVPVFERFRGAFVGKISPVHFWWGGFDLACTRFSGATAPLHPGGIPNTPDFVTREGYSHACISAGWWPGGGAVAEPAFYAYAYPEPPGLGEARIAPAAARYDPDMGEFILPYDEVRNAGRPEAALLDFLLSTYGAAADRAGWDRAALERPLDYDPRKAFG